MNDRTVEWGVQYTWPGYQEVEVFPSRVDAERGCRAYQGDAITALVARTVVRSDWAGFKADPLAPVASGRPTAVRVVWDLVAAGVSAPGDLQAQSGYSETAVRNALRELADAGRVHNPRHGVWEPVRQEAAA